jgi:glycosyltransferase involved in cell wall biosynthesis
MRIVYVATFLPVPPADGGRLVNYHFLRGLAAHGHDVTLVVPLRRPEDPASLPAMEAVCATRARRVRARSAARTVLTAALRGASLRIERHRLPVMAREVEDALEPAPDVVVLDSLFTAYLLPVVRARRPDVPVVLLEHNVESMVFRRLVDTRGGLLLRAAAAWETPRIAAAERRAVRAVDLVLALSPNDARALQAMAPDTRIEVCPPGTATHEGAAVPPPPDARTVLFLGSYLYPPNVDGARWMARSVWPRVRRAVPDARLVLAGADPRGEVRALADAAQGVEAPGFVEDSAATIRSAAVFAVPLRAGGGVRLKILEALANERPVVSTTIGAEGLPVEDGRHVVAADGEITFARAVVRLLGDRPLAEQLAREGRALVEERFSWPSAAARVEAALQRAANAGRAR